MPLCGSDACMLGVRSGVDIHPDPAGMVVGGAGGLSTCPDPAKLPRHRRPIRFGGIGKLPLFEISSGELGTQLAHRWDGPQHVLIEPSQRMHLDAYQAALAETRRIWQEVP